MYTLSDTTKKNIERVIGLSLDKLKVMSISEEKAWVEKRNNKDLSFSKHLKHGFIGRGNPLLAKRKIRTLADLNKIYDKIIKK